MSGNWTTHIFHFLNNTPSDLIWIPLQKLASAASGSAAKRSTWAFSICPFIRIHHWVVHNNSWQAICNISLLRQRGQMGETTLTWRSLSYNLKWLSISAEHRYCRRDCMPKYLFAFILCYRKQGSISSVPAPLLTELENVWVIETWHYISTSMYM